MAHDLRSVGDLAMEFGCSMAELRGAQLHVLHSLEFPELDSALPARISAERSTDSRTEAVRYISVQLASYKLATPPRVHAVTDTPDFAIFQHTNNRAVELLVMGTITLTGIAGFVVGNTAERLLPRIPCSVLAVNPDDFICTVDIQ